MGLFEEAYRKKFPVLEAAPEPVETFSIKFF